jgi:hypothetical protein
MARFWAASLVGVIDGTLNPPRLVDGRIFGAKERGHIAAKNPNGGQQALAIADEMVIGRLPPSAIPVAFRAYSDTSLTTTTLSIGIAGALTKYVNAATLTTVGQLVDLPMVAAGLENRLFTAGQEEELIMTVGGLAIPAATKLFILPRFQISA